ncbi:MAG: DUF167 domain-containing protein [Planctomycetota bacterium]
MGTYTPVTIVETAAGLRFAIRVIPGAQRNAIGGVRAAQLLIRTTAPPEKGQANEAVLRLLADALQVAKSAVEIVSGHGHRSKQCVVRGLERTEFEKRLRDLIGNS